MAKKKINVQDMDVSKHPDDGGVLSPGPGRESYKLASFWKEQVEAVDQVYARFHRRGNTILRRYRDERNRTDEEGQRRMNLLWANVKVMKPAIYSKCPIPVVDRKFLDRDPIGRLSSQMLERVVKNELHNGFHSSVTKAVYDRLLPGRGVIWFRYEPEFGLGETLPSATVNGIEDELVRIGNEVGEGNLTDESQEEENLEDSQETVVSEKVVCDYVDWKDYYEFPAKARTWDEVQAVGKKVYISKQEAKERFGDEIGSAMRAETTPMGSTTERITYSETAVFQDINERNIEVFEIWNKSDMRVYWISKGYMYLADVKEDPLKLKKFFPIPDPLAATLTSDTRIPVADYIEWQDQAIQIDELTQRIAMLTKACKVAGAYNAANVALGRILEESVENQLIPVDQWAMFAENGGIEGNIAFLPLDQIQKCIETLMKVRQQAMMDLDQITGLSDIVRGTSDSRETLGGIRLKNNNAGTRLSESQEDVARFARDGIQIISEIICKHFSDETLIEASGIMYEEELQPETILRELEAPSAPVAGPQPDSQGKSPSAPQMPGSQGQLPAPNSQSALPPPPNAQPNNNVIPFPGQENSMPQGQPGLPMLPMQPPPPPDPELIAFMKVQKAIELLRKDVTRDYRIDIETDSTIFGDKMQERQDANEFMAAMSQYMKSFEGMAQSEPDALPLLGRALQWLVRRYRTGRDLESEIDSFVTKMTKKAKMLAENPPPDPEQMKANAEIEQMKMEGQIQAQNDQRDAQKQAAEDERTAKLQEADDMRKIMMTKMENEYKERALKLQDEISQREHALEMEKLDREAVYSKQEHEFKLKELEIGLQAKKKAAAQAGKKKAS